MVKLDFQIDFGSGYRSVPPPRNWKAMQVQLIWAQTAGQMSLQAQLQSIVFEFVKVNASDLIDYKDRGLTGGTGIFEGPGLRIYAGDSALLIFDGCIDTADEGFRIENDIVMCPIKESGKIDWMNDVAQSITFEYLASLPSGKPGRITRADYKQVPYAISTIPDYTQAMMLSITLFIIIKESVDVVAKIASLITRAISQSLSWLQLIGTIIEIILYLVYLVAIVTASAKLMQQIADNLLQPKKTKLGMREADLWLKLCEYFGLNFQSSIYGIGTAAAYNGRYANATLIPVKIKIPDGDPSFEIWNRPPDETTNPDSHGYYEGTPKQFIDDMCNVYNAMPVIKGNTLYFEEVHKFNAVNPFRLPNEGNVGFTFEYPKPYSTNASEIPLVYILRFQKDDQDLNTYNDYKGTYCLAQTKPNIVRNQKNQLARGSKIIDLPFALARRKVGFTKLEKALLEVLQTCANFINSIGDNVNEINDKLSSWMPTIVSAENVGLSNTQVGIAVGFLTGQPVFSVVSIVLGSDGLPIMPSVTIPNFSNDRIGWMLLSSDFIGVQKRFIGTSHGDDWYVDENNSEGTFNVTFSPTLSGVFTGTIVGPMGFHPFTGTITAGMIFGTCSTASLGPATGIITGTIAGMTGTFTGTVSGTMGGGSFTGVGAINTSVLSTISTQGWGSAKSLMEDFHIKNTMGENQYLIFKDKTFKIGMTEYLKIHDNNVFQTADGKWGKFDKIVWDLHNDKAIGVDYRIKERYTNNFTTTITTDGG